MIKETIWTHDDFFISTDKSLLELEVIYRFLHHDSYWAKGIDRNLVEEAIRNSILCYGVYEGTLEQRKLVGFARVVSDLVRFSWLGDVFILPEYRGRGLSKWLMSIIIEHPQLKGTSFNLSTEDAHALYQKYGFKPLTKIENRLARPLDWEAINEGLNINI
ncbi:GNAT family N-acetyltransferase [Cytobacillus sp. FJAT-54145]|uniref:GNAT family N-acetyltransferase n=1 Tax=Cytobacillus spartinae TaxID=3299023 RepID=A0ABW6KFE6_9BACI